MLCKKASLPLALASYVPRVRITAVRTRARRMPNRGPLELSAAEAAALLAELRHIDMADAEDADERERYKLICGARERVQLAASHHDGVGTVIAVLSSDELDTVLDVLPPPPALGTVREKLGALHEALLRA